MSSVASISTGNGKTHLPNTVYYKKSRNFRKLCIQLTFRLVLFNVKKIFMFDGHFSGIRFVANMQIKGNSIIEESAISVLKSV